jgi:hypothetical protein
MRRNQPYYIPLRHRQRTKSESQDNQTILDNASMEVEAQQQMETDITGVEHPLNNSQFNKIKLVQLKKSKSCENLSTTKDELRTQNFSSNASATMEFFVNRIQKLNLVHD